MPILTTPPSPDEWAAIEALVTDAAADVARAKAATKRAERHLTQLTDYITAHTVGES